MPRIFIHGLQSSNQGTKALYFKKHFPDMMVPNFTGSLEARMIQLNGVLADLSNLVLVGSSFGGMMAAIYAGEYESKVQKMVLLAPALNFAEFRPYKNRTISVPVRVYQGRKDTVTPLAEIAPIAGNIFPDLHFIEVDDDHLLRNTFGAIDWTDLLS